MGKQGPCRHCGVTSTPLWRNGPPEKPVLCNACGSRWRTKGSLVNYIPLHAREAFDSDELKVPKIKCTTSFKPKEQKLHKKKQSNHRSENEWEMQYCDQNFHKLVEGDTSNRSSSGSAMSGSDSCVKVGTIDASDVTGSVQSKAYDLAVLPRKRAFSTRPKASVEKLTKDLHSILHEEQASNLSRTTDDDLLYESSAPLGSFEIGYGGVLIKHPNSKSVDEESEASSFPVDKPYITNEGYSGSASFPVNTKSKGILNSGTGTVKTVGQVAPRENAKRDKSGHENSNILLDRDSAVGSADLNVIINFESFMKYLTHEERQQLMKYLPYIDIIRPPESLRNVFTSPQFLETLSFFQQLLREGVFDLSLSNAHAEECRILKRLVLLNSTKHQWLEYYQKIKDAAPSKNMKGGNGASNRQKFPSLSNSASLTRQHDWQNENQSELKSIMRSPTRVNPPSGCSTQMDSSVVTKVTDDTEDVTDHDGTPFSIRRIFASPPDTSSVLAPMQFVADSSEGDMLLDAPAGASFPEAELLYHPWKQKAHHDGSPTASAIEASDLPSSSFSNKCFKNG